MYQFFQNIDGSDRKVVCSVFISTKRWSKKSSIWIPQRPSYRFWCPRGSAPTFFATSSPSCQNQNSSYVIDSKARSISPGTMSARTLNMAISKRILPLSSTPTTKQRSPSKKEKALFCSWRTTLGTTLPLPNITNYFPWWNIWRTEWLSTPKSCSPLPTIVPLPTRRSVWVLSFATKHFQMHYSFDFEETRESQV